MFDISSFMQGLALGLGLFICPGPKDVLILRQALLRRSPVELIAVGFLSDALLIWLGMAGVSAALNRAPELQTIALWLGVCLMVGHGLLAARNALRGTANVGAFATQDQTRSRGKNFTSLLAASFLNPVGWLDTVLIIGTVGAALAKPAQLSFGVGAVVASFAWFLVLVLGARSAARWVAKPSTWRVLEALVALAMFGLAASVLVEHYEFSLTAPR